MDLGEIYDTVNYLLKKEKSGKIMSPGEFNLVFDLAQSNLYKYVYGLKEEYKPMLPVPSVAYEVSQNVTDIIQAFKQFDNNVAVAGGQFALSSLTQNYRHMSSMTYDNSGAMVPVDIEILNDAEFASRQNQSIKAPSANNPVSTIIGSNVKILPITLTAIDATYLRDFIKSHYDYMVDSVTHEQRYVPPGAAPVDYGGSWAYVDGRAAATLSSSVETEFPNFSHIDLIGITLSYMSVSLANQFIYETSEIMKQKGR